MKLRNKKTGEIIDLAKRGLLKSDNDNHIIVYPEGTLKYYAYDSLTEFNEEWGDAPNTVWYITHDGSIHSADIGNSWTREKNIGNYFEAREEAEKAVEKLKAWKRLKDKGFRFNNCEIEMSEITVPEITITAFIDTEEPETLNLVNLLFGGEE